jgi:hypothetical protein
LPVNSAVPISAADSRARRRAATTGAGFDRLSILMTALTGALLIAAIAPLFAVEIPAMLDYINHLARMYILAGPANPAYETHWGLQSNLAMDIAVPALAHWMSVATATKLFLGAGQILVVTGAVFLEVTIKGRHRLGGLGALLALFSLPFAWGEVNFLFGTGVAVWGLALWMRLQDRSSWMRWAVHAAIVAILSVAHVFALGVYGLSIALYELSRFEKFPSLVALAKLALFMASPLLVVFAPMVLAGGGAGSLPGLDWDFGLKLGWPAVFMNVYDTSLSMLSAAAMLALVLVLAVARRLSLTRAGLWIAGGLAAVYLAMPRQLLGSQYLDVRLLTVAVILLPAFARTTLGSRPWRVAPLAVVIAVIAANAFTTGHAWLDYDQDIKEFKASFALLPRGSAVLIGQRDQAGRDYQPVYYAATLAAPAAGAFVSSLYAQPGMQPIEPRARYSGLAVKEEREAYPPRLSLLQAAMKPDAPAGTQANIVHWPERYQYLYLLGDHAPNPLPATLTPVFEGRRFSLFRIERPARL